MRKLAGLLAVLALVFAACSESTGSTTVATTADTQASSDDAGSEAGFGDPENGAVLYQGSCQACHGPEGTGIEGLGKPWVGSEFINDTSDGDLVEFLKVGRPSDDPLNTTGIAMLPYGGNPSLTEDDLKDLVAYMRTLNT